MPFSVETFRLSQPALDEVKILLGHCNTLLGLLLEGVQDVDSCLKPHIVDGAPDVAVLVRDNFKHRSSAKTFERLGRGIDFTLLGGIERLADIAPHLARERGDLFGLSPSIYDGTFGSRCHTIISLLVYHTSMLAKVIRLAIN